MTASHIFYFILSMVILFLAYQAEQMNNSVYVKLIVCLLTLVAGLRNIDVGRDTITYTKYFDMVCCGYKVDVETGFVVLMKLVSLVSKNPNTFFTLCALITYGCVAWRMWELREDSGFCIAFFSYYTFYFFGSMNVMRQYMSVAILFWATRYIKRMDTEQGAYAKFIFFLLIATSIHTSSILGIVFIVVQLFFLKYQKAEDKYKLAILGIVGCIAFAAFIPAMESALEKYTHYTSNVDSDMGMRIPALLAIWIVSILVYRSSDAYINDSSDWENYLLSTTRFYFLLSCLLSLIGYKYKVVGRVSWMFNMFQGVYYGIILREWSEVQRVLLKVMVYVVVGYVLVQYVFLLNGDNIHPYKTFWM